jgi:hypothetical protein
MNKVLWCHGNPGAGKTVLTSLVINNLTITVGKDAGLAYFYYDYADEQIQAADKIIASLLKQLCLSKSPLLTYIAELY